MDFQKINEKKIICKFCQNNKLEAYNNKFYICCKCNINLCPLCKSSHDKKHIIIDYENKNIFCNQHGERYIIYSKDNNKNICDLCYKKSHNHIFLYNIFKNIKNLNNINKFQMKINNLKNEMKKITNNNEINLVIDNFEKFYNIGQNIINYNKKINNYYFLLNKKKINDYNTNIIKDIDKIINEKEENKLKYIKEIYDKMVINNIITLKYATEIFTTFRVEKVEKNFKYLVNYL